jgi:DHA1 family tetracycline resistance protein-like MFS transporter
MQFLFGPTLGNLSDRFGRRPVLLIALAVMSVDYLVMAVAGSIWALLALRLVNGVTASTHSTAAAYMADISRPDQKAARFGLIGAAFGAGFVLGPIVGGLLAEFGTRAPFYAAAGLAFANMVFGWLVLPETVTDRIRRPFRWQRANPFGAFRAIGHLPGARRLMAVFFLNQVAFLVYPTTWSYFSTERFDWSPSMIGVSLAAFGVSMVLVQGVLIRPILARFGEVTTVLLGLGFNLVTLLVIAAVTNGLLALLLAPLMALGGVVNPALQGLLSRSATDDQQGELQGVLASISSVAMILSPLMMTWTFAHFTAPGAPAYLPGAPFLVAAALMVVCLGVILPARGNARARHLPETPAAR